VSDEQEQDDVDAGWNQKELEDMRRREDELLARAPAAHAELARIQAETTETCKAINWAIDRIFHG
jgi:hypothetical protein